MSKVSILIHYKNNYLEYCIIKHYRDMDGMQEEKV